MSKEQTPKEYRNNIHYWNEEVVSKKQTPITAEEFRNDYAKKLQYLNWDDLCEDLWSKGDAMTKTENEVMEQYAQAKVLEALEREFTNYENNNPNKGHIEHYETEVKPKYE